jgi:predicted metal-dependent hydrolase
MTHSTSPDQNVPFEINQILRSKRKTIALIIKPDGSLLVRAPLWTADKEIVKFIRNNTSWIEKKQAEARATLPMEPKQYCAGELFLYLGNTYPLEIVKGQKKPLLLEASFQLAETAHPEAGLAFERWYRNQARHILTERVNVFASQYDLHFQGIKITSARTRWGSCSSNGSLNFSWRLILAPMEAVDYVVVHELVHTIYHNHAKRFWKKVEEILPDYRERRKWLRNNGQRLIL